MIQDIVSALDYSDCAEAALLIFVAAFVLIFYGALRLSREATDRFASIQLSDEVKDQFDGK